jgi:hypothetical protein
MPHVTTHEVIVFHDKCIALQTTGGAEGSGAECSGSVGLDSPVLRVSVRTHQCCPLSPQVRYVCVLCTHAVTTEPLVRPLGARCEANTFDGERCVYGSLTPEIRNILVKDYVVITSKIIQRNDYDEFLRK